MSVEQIQQQILEFLNSSYPGSMSIRGAWGVGKTYAWKTYIKHAQSDDQLYNDRYSYVSLFGIDSLKDLKFQIFQQTIPKKDIDKEVTAESVLNNVLNIDKSKWRTWIAKLSTLPHIVNFSDALESVAFLSINKSLICIDDLERKGKNLSMTDVLGLVSLLKEEKGCKVVLIHNEGEFDKKDRKEFDKYREKVIDIEFEFKPSPSECTSIAFEGNNDLYQKLTLNCNKLGIDNIRILKKIEGLAARLLPYVQNFEPEIMVQSLRTLCLYTWCRYSPDDVSPSYGYVKNITQWMMGLTDNERYTESEKRWNAALQDYGYVLTDELDLAISALIETGYVSEDNLYPAAKKKNEEAIAMKGQESFIDAWKLYHLSFKNNEEEVIQHIFEAFKKWVNFVSPNNLQATVGVLRELKRNDLADEAIEYYIESRKSEKELFRLQDDPFSDNVTDKTIINRFEETFESISGITEQSLYEVVIKVADKNEWSQKDVQILTDATVDDYYKLFKSIEGEHLPKCIKACLSVGKSGNASKQEKEILEKASSALKMIGNESNINKLRVKKYGIRFDENGLA